MGLKVNQQQVEDLCRLLAIKEIKEALDNIGDN